VDDAGRAKPGAGQAALTNPRLPTGDFWPTDDGMTRTARTPAAPYRDAAKPEEVATGSIK
jgi:hypothetical protein